jgi:hypothetical protein
MQVGMIVFHKETEKSVGSLRVIASVGAQSCMNPFLNTILIQGSGETRFTLLPR